MWVSLLGVVLVIRWLLRRVSLLFCIVLVGWLVVKYVRVALFRLRIAFQ